MPTIHETIELSHEAINTRDDELLALFRSRLNNYWVTATQLPSAGRRPNHLKNTFLKGEI